MILPLLTVYSRPGCHLCEKLIEELLPLIRDRAELEVLNIDTRADWTQAYGSLIPLVELNGRALCHYHLDRGAVVAALDAVDRSQ
jgi:hypothetical protein